MWVSERMFSITIGLCSVSVIYFILFYYFRNVCIFRFYNIIYYLFCHVKLLFISLFLKAFTGDPWYIVPCSHSLLPGSAVVPEEPWRFLLLYIQGARIDFCNDRHSNTSRAPSALSRTNTNNYTVIIPPAAPAEWCGVAARSLP